MENYKYQNHSHTCSCENQHLLEYGMTCNLCMGVVRKPDNILENLLPESKFDDRYFEELEAYYYGNEDLGMAA